MRHRVYGRRLGRDVNSRKALLKNIANDLILRGKVRTTLAKAKFAQSHAEKLITAAKKTKLGQRRVIASTLTDKAFVRLVEEIAPGFEGRLGGYTRIVKLTPRVGDNASMARIELLEWDKSKVKNKSSKEKPKAQATKLATNKKMAVAKKSIVKKSTKSLKKSNR